VSGAEQDVQAPADEGFLSRWSRLKQQPEPLDEVEPAATSSEQAGADGEPATEAPLTDADMPPLESLTESSDFSGFLSPEVSEELRRLALRKLFRSAVFNVRDGLDDYDDDFTSFAKLGDLITSDMRHQIEQAAKQLAEKADHDEAPQALAESESAPVQAESDGDETPGPEDELTEDSL